MGSRIPAQLWSPSSAHGVAPHPLPRMEEEPRGISSWRRPLALLGPGRPSAGRPQLWDSANPTQIHPGVGPGLGLVGMALGQGLSFTLCLAHGESDRAGGCLKVEEAVWLGGRGWAEVWFPVPSAGKTYASCSPLLLSFSPPLVAPLHCCGRGPWGPPEPSSRPSSSRKSTLNSPVPTKLFRPSL